MPRTSRIDAPNLVQHVFSRGIEKRNIFVDDLDRHFFLKKLKMILKDAKSPCYAWVLMPNHFHLCIRTAEHSLSKIMCRLLSSYATYFNQRHKRVGHLFQNRYKSIIVEENNYLATLIPYIHLNPLRAGLIKKDDFNKYEWSGHTALIGKINHSWQDTKFVLNFFGGKKMYLKYLELQINHNVDDLVGGGLKRDLLAYVDEKAMEDDWRFDHRILGSYEFAELLLKKNETNRVKPSKKHFAEITLFTCDFFNVTVQGLRGGSRKRQLSQARGVVSSVGFSLGFSGAEIARRLNITEAAVIKAKARGDKLIGENEELKMRIKNRFG